MKKVLNSALPSMAFAVTFAIIFLCESIFFNKLFIGKNNTFYQANICLGKKFISYTPNSSTTSNSTQSLYSLIQFTAKKQKNSSLFTTISVNQSINKTASNLAKHNIIQNRLLFIIFSNIYKKIFKSSIEAGEYTISLSSNQFTILLKLQNKNSVVRKLYIPDGSNEIEVKNIINNAYGLVGKTPDIKNGSILPDTYFYTYGTKRLQLIKNMQKDMQKILTQAHELFLNRISQLQHLKPKYTNPKLLTLSLNEFLVLCSIVEKECTNIDRSIIAGVFLNRLEKNQRIQACSTVIYEITQGNTKIFKISIKDTRYRNMNSPQSHAPQNISSQNKNSCNIKSAISNSYQDVEYNTYLIHGLPKSPICNPSKKTILAVANFEKTQMMFFLWNENTHTHEFSKNFQNHKAKKIQKNIAKNTSKPNKNTYAKSTISYTTQKKVKP